MIVLGLVHDHGWEDRPEPEDPAPVPVPRHRWRLPWRPLAWIAAFCWLMALVPIASDAFGGLAGYGVLMVAVALGFWRLDRWCARQYWRGLREYQA